MISQQRPTPGSRSPLRPCTPKCFPNPAGNRFIEISADYNISVTGGEATRTLSANRIGLTASNDLTLVGSTLVADNDITALAGNTLNLTSAQNTRSASHFSATQKSGLSFKGLTKSRTEETLTERTLTQSGSSLRSAQGNIALHANLNQNSAIDQGAVFVDSRRIIADAGRVDISGKHIIVSADFDQSSRERLLKESKSTFAFNTGLPTGRKHAIEESAARSTLKASTIQGEQGVTLTAREVIDITAAHLAAAQGDIAIRGAVVSIQSGLEQSRSDFKEATKKTGVNLKDLTGTFTPGQGVGFKSTLTKENAQTSLAPATLDANNITLQSTQGDLTLAAVQATARGQSSDQPGTLTLDAANNLKLASLTTTEQHSTDLKKKDIAWQSVKGNGALDETPQYTQLNAAQLNISTGNRITADLSVKDSAAILAQEAGMGWLKQLQDDPNLASRIDWNKIEEAHQSWNYKQQGLTPAAAAVVAIVVA